MEDDDGRLVETKLASFFHALFAKALAARELRRKHEEDPRERAIEERAKRAESIRCHDEVVERVRAAGREEDAAWITWAMGHAARLDLQVVDALPSMTVHTDDEEEQPPDDDE